MGLGLTLFILFSITAIAGLIIWLAMLYFKEHDEKHDDPLVINMMSNYSSPVAGHAIGFEVSTTKVDNRYLIEYSPRDVDKKYFLENKKVENVKVVVDKNKIITLEKGTLSNFRTIKILLPPNAEDFGTELKLHPFGKIMMDLTESINSFNVESSMVRKGSNMKTKILERMGDGEISKEYMNSIDDQTKELVKRRDGDSKPQQRTGGFNPPSGV